MKVIVEKYWWVVVLLILIVAFAAVKYLHEHRDGISASGIFDDDTEGSLSTTKSTPTVAVTYKQSPIALKNFKIAEFDSPDLKGSGENMHVLTLQMLDHARDLAGIAFKINSGFRTIAHNAALQGQGSVTDSAHTRGYAADISARTEEKQRIILKSLYTAGFRRFGVYGTFIHADNDPDKKPNSIWTGKGGVIRYNPLTAA